MLWLWLIAAAWPHGSAPAALQVLTTDGVSSCEATRGDPLPGLVRTNIGLARHRGDGRYDYVCPSAWDGPETALSAADPTGQAIVVAWSQGVMVSMDGGDHFEPLETGPGSARDVVWHEGAFWLAWTENGEHAVLHWLPGETPTREVLELGRIDGLLASPDGTIWAAGADPSPWIAARRGTWRGEVVDVVADRVVPRQAIADGVTVEVGLAGARELIDVEDGVVTGRSPVGARVLGPVWLGERRVAVVDGAWLVDDGAGWTDSGVDVDWTCLEPAEEGAWACSLEGITWLSDDWSSGQAATAIAWAMEQIGPTPAGALAEACVLDWAHFGGESRWLGTDGAACPDADRSILGDAGDEEAGRSCEGCDSVRGLRGGAWIAALGLLLWRRRWGSVSAGTVLRKSPQGVC